MGQFAYFQSLPGSLSTQPCDTTSNVLETCANDYSTAKGADTTRIPQKHCALTQLVLCRTQCPGRGTSNDDARAARLRAQHTHLTVNWNMPLALSELEVLLHDSCCFHITLVVSYKYQLCHQLPTMVPPITPRPAAETKNAPVP